ncbi:MAG TPA: hypothetical protein VIY70_02665 [Acidimicrobiia bacterium]
MEFAARIAPEIDRLVLAVNTISGSESGRTLDELASALGIGDHELLKHYAEFLLAGRLTPELAVRRVPYQPRERVERDIATWHRLGLVEDSDGLLGARPRLVPLLEAVLAGRTAVATRLWSANDFLPAALDLAGKAAGRLGGQFVLARAHQDLPAPRDRHLRLHHQLTSLRYARSQAHAEAWRAAGLVRAEILALTASWHGRPAADTATVERLIERGLAFEDGALTVAGMRLRQEIEDATNHATAPAFETLDDDERENLIVSLAMLPGEPIH